jgi:hypothetical protein
MEEMMSETDRIRGRNPPLAPGDAVSRRGRTRRAVVARLAAAALALRAGRAQDLNLPSLGGVPFQGMEEAIMALRRRAIGQLGGEGAVRRFDSLREAQKVDYFFAQMAERIQLLDQGITPPSPATTAATAFGRSLLSQLFPFFGDRFAAKLAPGQIDPDQRLGEFTYKTVEFFIARKYGGPAFTDYSHRDPVKRTHLMCSILQELLPKISWPNTLSIWFSDSNAIGNVRVTRDYFIHRKLGDEGVRAWDEAWNKSDIMAQSLLVKKACELVLVRGADLLSNKSPTALKDFKYMNELDSGEPQIADRDWIARRIRRTFGEQFAKAYLSKKVADAEGLYRAALVMHVAYRIAFFPLFSENPKGPFQ